MVVNGSKIVPKSSKKFVCADCDYSTSRKSQYSRHLLTAKHLTRVNDSKMIVKKFQEVPTNKRFICDCGKEYKYDSGFYRHKRLCTYTEEPTDQKDSDKLELYKELFPYIKDMMVEMMPKMQPATINSNNTNNNTNNNIFNIQLFLNEDCKDAMNMTEFIESIQLTLEDMTKINLEGQTEGISKLLINKLQNIDILKRPMHCSDSKKEIIYVKDEDKWEEEGKDKSKIKKALDKITMKSIETLPSINQDPDDYVNTVNELLKEPREDKKIISKLAKEVCVK